MKLAVGAPVADRAWALPHWFECLHSQTRPPDQFLFVSGGGADGTNDALHEGADGADILVLHTSVPSVPRWGRPRIDKRVLYTHFSEWRNTLLVTAAMRDVDVYLSLDTDVMLEEPTAIERLLHMLQTDDLASPCTFLHAAGAESACYNAGFWTTRGRHDTERAWRRATPGDAAEAQQPIRVDIPMAAVAMNASVTANCRYRYHECGEDLGFAQDIERHGFSATWDAGLQVRHVWGEEYL